MIVADSKSLARSAQRLVVEARRGQGSPPVFEPAWQMVWGAAVDRIDINKSADPSVATIWFPSLRWNEPTGLNKGDLVRIRTDEFNPAGRTILFEGYFVKRISDFSGGSGSPGSSYERNAVVCLDARWLLKTAAPVYGRLIRGPDDYTGFGTSSQTPINNSCIFASGLRIIFNEDGLPNKDPTPYIVTDAAGIQLCSISIFADPAVSNYWTARDMLIYLLSKPINVAYDYFAVVDPAQTVGLDHPDLDVVLNNICVDGLSLIDAVDLIAKQLNFSFRLDFSSSGPQLIFYKTASADSYVRSSADPVILHRLYAPGVGENVATGVAAGKKILWTLNLSEDIESCVNNPWGIGFPDQFELTAELVPAWLDEDLSPDSQDSYKYLYLTEKEIQDLSSPDTYTFFKYYHAAGANFRREVARKWCLNETGRYTIPFRYCYNRYYRYYDLVLYGSSTYYRCINPHYSSSEKAPANPLYWQLLTNHYDRGAPFNFANYIPSEYIKDSAGKRLYAPLARQLLPALTIDKNSLNSLGIIVELSMDGGATWQLFNGVLRPLKDEAGLYIAQPNLSEVLDLQKRTITSGDLDDKELNYWTSLADDKVNARSFKNAAWRTRVRATFSIQMDRRLAKQSPVDIKASGSPFHHSQLFDFSAKYGLKKRTTASKFEGGDYPAWNVDDSDWADQHLGGIRRSNEDAAISGSFTLERLWLGDGQGVPAFALGDCIEKIEGRNYSLAASFGQGKIYPEIIQLIYMPDRQKMQLITRDMRYAARIER